MIELGQMKNKTLEELEKELEDLKASHRNQWDTYGSELCAGDMIAQEDKLEKEIVKRKTKKEEEYINDVSQVLDNTTQPATGIEQLRKVKEETTNRWKKSGLLDGLTGGVPDNLAKMFEPNAIQRIPENETFSRDEVIIIVKRYAFHLSDNGDPDEDVKEWFDRNYPVE
jgi:hypothetical protein